MDETYTSTINIRINGEPEPYTPRVGDVLESGRVRIMVRESGDRLSNISTVHGQKYRRLLFAADWLPVGGWLESDMLAMLVNLDGWKVIYRTPEASQ